MHPLQAAVSFLFLLSALIVLLTAFQASTEVLPELDFLKDKVAYEGIDASLAEAMVREVKKLKVKAWLRPLIFFLLKNADEYLKFGILSAAATEASRAYSLMKRWRTT